MLFLLSETINKYIKEIKDIFKKIVPIKYQIYIRQVYCFLRSLLFFGNKFICPVCGGHFRKFLPAGIKLRPNAKCPLCDSGERHRLLWLYLKERTNFFSDKLKVLEVAPKWFLQKKFKNLSNIEYTSIDISSPLAMLKMNITDIKFPDLYFDCIICYHVLEHVEDDYKAMSELFRVLKFGGWAIIQSPIDKSRKKTFEDPNVVSCKAREKIFGHFDHVRIYGYDYKNRLEESGFIVRVDDYIAKLPDIFIKKYGLDKNEYIYFCTKPRLRNG